MARIKGGVGVMISGKLDGVVFVQREGMAYVRAAPQYTDKSWTPRQKQHRERFRKVNEFCMKFRTQIILPIWNLLPGRASGYHQFLKANMAAFSAEGDLTDISMLHFSNGSLPFPFKFKAGWESVETTLLQFTWENDALMFGKLANDELQIITSSEGTFNGPFATSIKRSQLNGKYTLPVNRNKVEAIYVYFAAADYSNYSIDKYFALN
jgi:hypothetical protein